LLGYSAYLHPVGEGLLLGIGQDATAEGRVLGTQASLFDVSNPATPRRLDSFALGKGWSEAEQDQHAFLWWPRSGLAVLPVQAQRRPAVRRRAGAARASRRRDHRGRARVASAHVGRGSRRVAGHADPPLGRRQGRALHGLGGGVRGSRLGSFADLGFARLPQSETPKPVSSR
jgi:hypothetical protein